MHGSPSSFSSTSAAFVCPRGMIDTGKRPSLTKDGQRFRPEPVALMPTGLEGEAFGLAKDILTAAVTGASGDIIAQLAEKQKTDAAKGDTSWFPLADELEEPFFELDVRRSASYATFAAAYTGAFQHFLFANLQEALPDPVTRLAVNQGLIIPLCYYTLLLLVLPKLRATSVEEEEQLRSSINIQKMIPRNWAFWVPLQFIQFNFIPTEFQVVYCSFLGLIWNVCLSLFTAGGAKVDSPSEEVVVKAPAQKGGEVVAAVTISYSDDTELVEAFQTASASTNGGNGRAANQMLQLVSSGRNGTMATEGIPSDVASTLRRGL